MAQGQEITEADPDLALKQHLMGHRLSCILLRIDFIDSFFIGS